MKTWTCKFHEGLFFCVLHVCACVQKCGQKQREKNEMQRREYYALQKQMEQKRGVETKESESATASIHLLVNNNAESEEN